MTQHRRNRNKPAAEGSYLHPELVREPQNGTRPAKELACVQYGPKELIRAASSPEQLRPCNHLQCFCEGAVKHSPPRGGGSVAGRKVHEVWAFKHSTADVDWLSSVFCCWCFLTVAFSSPCYSWFSWRAWAGSKPKDLVPVWLITTEPDGESFSWHTARRGQAKMLFQEWKDTLLEDDDKC